MLKSKICKYEKSPACTSSMLMSRIEIIESDEDVKEFSCQTLLHCKWIKKSEDVKRNP